MTSKGHSFTTAPAHISNELIKLDGVYHFWEKCILIEVANSQVNFKTTNHQDFNISHQM